MGTKWNVTEMELLAGWIELFMFQRVKKLSNTLSETTVLKIYS